MDETGEHIMAAGKELLLAAGGALKCCKDYVETSVPEASRTNLLSFFQKAISVADELSRGICGVSTIKRTAGTIAKPLFTAMAKEMKAEREEAEEPTLPTAKRRAARRAKPSRRKGRH